MCMKEAYEALEKSIIAETRLLPNIHINFYDGDIDNSVLNSSLGALSKAAQLSQVFGKPAVFTRSDDFQWYNIGKEITLFFNEKADLEDLLNVRVPF